METATPITPTLPRACLAALNGCPTKEAQLEFLLAGMRDCSAAGQRLQKEGQRGDEEKNKRERELYFERYDYACMKRRIETEDLNKVRGFDTAESLLEAEGLTWPGDRVTYKWQKMFLAVADNLPEEVVHSGHGGISIHGAVAQVGSPLCIEVFCGLILEGESAAVIRRGVKAAKLAMSRHQPESKALKKALAAMEGPPNKKGGRGGGGGGVTVKQVKEIVREGLEPITRTMNAIHQLVEQFTQGAAVTVKGAEDQESGGAGPGPVDDRRQTERGADGGDLEKNPAAPPDRPPEDRRAEAGPEPRSEPVPDRRAEAGPEPRSEPVPDHQPAAEPKTDSAGPQVHWVEPVTVAVLAHLTEEEKPVLQEHLAMALMGHLPYPLVHFVRAISERMTEVEQEVRNDVQGWLYVASRLDIDVRWDDIYNFFINAQLPGFVDKLHLLRFAGLGEKQVAVLERGWRRWPLPPPELPPPPEGIDPEEWAPVQQLLLSLAWVRQAYEKVLQYPGSFPVMLVGEAWKAMKRLDEELEALKRQLESMLAERDEPV